jgi:hypothetical protein
MKRIILLLFLFSIFECRLDKIEMRKICSKCEVGFNDTYRDKELLNNTSEDDKINEYVITLVELLKSDFNSSDIMDQYVTPRVVYSNILFFILIGVLIVIWIVLIVLACYSEKVFKFKYDEKSHLKHHLMAYITVLLFLCVIVLSSISFVFIKKSEVYFNSSVCALLRLYIDIRDGDQTDTTYWKGIRGLQVDLKANDTAVDELMKTIELHDGVMEELNNNKFLKNTYADDEKTNNYYSDSKVTSPSSTSSKVYPSYSKNRLLNLAKINLDYSLKLSIGVDKNKQIQIQNKLIKNKPKLVDSVSNEYNYINSELKDMINSISVTTDDYVQYIIDYSEYVNYVALPLLYSTFSLSIIFAVFGIIFTFLYIRDKKLTAKVKKIFANILHAIWNIILFLLLLTNVAQILFKIFEIFGEDGSGVVQYATSDENFKSSDSILFTGAGLMFLEMCFKQDDGDLLSGMLNKMDKGSSELSELKGILLQEVLLSGYYESIEKAQLNETQDLINDLEKMYEDYSEISYYSNLISIIESKCQNDFDTLNLYTDYSNPLISKQSKDSSDKHTYDVWTSLKENCKNYQKYEYINNKASRVDGNKYCMVIDDFERSDAKSLYSGVKTSSLLILDKKNVEDTFDEYYQALKLFKEDNKKLLGESPNFIKMTKNYYEELLAVKAKILEGLGYSKKIVDLINKILDGEVSSFSDGMNIFSAMNCQFIKRDLKVFYIEMEKLRANSAPFIILSFFIVISLLSTAVLTFLNVFKYKSQEGLKIEDIPTESSLMK